MRCGRITPCRQERTDESQVHPLAWEKQRAWMQRAVGMSNAPQARHLSGLLGIVEQPHSRA